MTELDNSTDLEQTARAADSGANATRVFQSKLAGGSDIPKERVDEVATAAIKALHEVIRDKQVTYEEYDYLKKWMIQVGLDGEWPLFLDVWLEHVVEEVANADREGSKGTIEGPYYVPDAPLLDSTCTLDDAGRRARHTPPLPGAGPRRRRHPPGGRGRRHLARGRPRLLLPVRPRACPTGSSVVAWSPMARDASRSTRCSRRRTRSRPTAPAAALIEAAGWHAWRPAHIHLKVSAPGAPARSPPSSTSRAASTSARTSPTR